MIHRISLDALEQGLAEAKAYHQRYRGPVKRQEALLIEAMSNELTGHTITELIENFTNNLVALLHPQMFQGDQTVVVRAPDGGIGAEAAAGLPYVIKRCWQVDGFDSELEQTITDIILGWGVMEVTRIDARVDRSRKKVIPVARHIHPDNFYVMPGVKRWEHSAAYFVKRVESKRWLLERAEKYPEENWKKSVIMDLPSCESYDGHQFADDLVYFYEGWCRPNSYEGYDLGPEPTNWDEYDGVSFWINEEGESVKSMQRFYGMKGGPYRMFGAMRSTTCLYYQGVAVSSANNAETVEHMLSTIQERVEAMQTLILTNQSETDLKEAIEKGIDGVIPMGPGWDKDSIQEVRLEGPRREQLEHLMLMKDQLYQTAGVTQMDLGKTGSRVSATEASMVHAKSNNRMDGLLNNLYRSLRGVATMMAFYACTDEDVVIPLGPDVSEEMGIANPEWVGGLPDGVTFESLGLEISVAYGHRMNPELMAARYAKGLEVALLAGNIQERFPDSNISELLRKIYDVMEIPELRTLVLGQAKEDPPSAAPIQQQQSPDPRAIPLQAQGGPVSPVQ